MIKNLIITDIPTNEGAIESLLNTIGDRDSWEEEHCEKFRKDGKKKK